MNPADKFLIFFGLLDLFYGYPLDFGPIIHPQFFFLYTENFDSVISFAPVNLKILTSPMNCVELKTAKSCSQPFIV